MKKLKVLLVDDSPLPLAVGKDVLESGGYEVITANDGVEALRLLSQHTFSAVITDILMPEMDGYSLCYKIRSNEKNDHIRIIIHSATYISCDDEKLALEFGADRVINKPVGMALFLDTVNEVISRPKKDKYKATPQTEMLEVSRLYNSQLIQRLEKSHYELQMAQRELLKNESQFRALVENINDAISLHDQYGNVLYQSPSVERLTGYSQEEAKSKKISDFFHPDDMPAILNQLQTVLQNPGIPVSSVKRFRHKDGHYIWTEGTTTNMLHDENVGAIVAGFRDVTMRKTAEEKIERNEKRFRALIENNFDAVSLFDEHGVVQYISPGAERMLGLTSEEAIGRPGTDFFHPDDVPEIRKRLESALQNPGKPIFRTNRLLHKDGHYVWVEGTTTNLLGDENVKAFVGNFRDITERKHAEERILKKQERLIAERERFSNLFLQAPSCICILKGENHVYEMANPLYLELTGKKDIVGKTAREVFPELMEQGFVGLLDNVYRTGIPVSGKEMFIQIDQLGNGVLTDHYMDFVYQPYKDHEGITEGIFFFANLVTEQVVARKKTEQHEKHFRALVENASDLIVLTDKNGNLTYVSPAHGKLTGCTAKDVMGKSFFSLQHPAHVSELKQQFKDLLNNPGVPMPRTSRFRRKDGTYVWVEGTVTNLLSDENVQSIIANFRDITAHKQHEEKLINANRLYAFISQINQTIVHVSNQQALFEKACSIAIEYGKFTMAWIGLFDNASDKITRVESCNIPGESYTLLADAACAQNAPPAYVRQTGRSFICNDIEKEPDPTLWKLFASKHGLESYMLLPIRKGGEIIGIFNFYSDKKDLFDETEIRLLEEATDDISFALDVFEKEKHRMEMEEKAKHSEMRLKQAQAIAHVGSWELDFSTGVALWSDEACRIYGFPLEENTQSFEAWKSSIHPDDREYVMKVTKEGEDKLSSSAFHHRIIRKDGTVRYIYSQALFEFDSDGRPTGLTGVAHDETEMKEAEISLAQSEGNLRLIMDMIPQKIFAKDTNGKFVFTNKSFAALYGVEPRDLINKSAWDRIYVKSELAGFMGEDKEVISYGRAITIPDQKFTDHSGNKLLFHTIKVPFTVAGTGELAVLGITTDITEQKRNEDERTKIIADMVHRNNDLEQFSFIVSHNLRAPVANILGLVNIMQTIGLEKDEVKNVTAFLDTAVKNLDNVIIDLNQILALKNNTGENRERINFADLLSEIRLSIDSLNNNEKVSITGNFSAAEEMTTVKSYLYSIFFNLILNAIKYRRLGVPPIIEITSSKINNRLKITFKDNGLGIDLKRIGSDLFRLYKRFHTHVEGKGMGLFMVKTQVELIGGEISVASHVNKGSEFTIEFEEPE